MKTEELPRLLRSLKISAIVGVSLLMLLPLVILLLQSFSSGWYWPNLLPGQFSIRAWEVLFREPKLITALWSTMAIGGMVVLLNLLIALPAGKALAHYSFKGKNTIEAVLMLPILIPSLALAMGLHITMIKTGLANNWLGVVLVHLIPTVPYSIRILRAGYQNIGVKWEEQAKTLGVGSRHIFFTIYLPLLLPSLRSACILAFVISLSQYILTALIGGGNVVTLAMVYYPYFLGTDRAVMASFSMLFALLPIVFLLFLELVITLLVPQHQRYSGM